MKIYISSLAEKSNSISEIIEKLALNGVNNIELTGGTKNSNFDLKELLELKAKYNLNYLCHNYFPPPKDDFIINLGSLNNEIFDKSIEHVKTAIMLSNTLESDKFACHSGFFIDFSLNEIDKAKEIFFKILDDEISNQMPLKIIEEAKKSFNEKFVKINWNDYFSNIPFNQSALSLYEWAPIAEELKSLDKKIVLNSVILKWDIIKKEFRERIEF